MFIGVEALFSRSIGKESDKADHGMCCIVSFPLASVF